MNYIRLPFYLYIAMSSLCIQAQTQRHDRPAHRPTTHAIRLVLGDITKQKFSHPDRAAIVNAANPQLCGGGGITGAIWRAAGDLTELGQAELRNPLNNSKVDEHGNLKTGQAIITSAKKLKARGLVGWVIHTPGPHGADEDRAERLSECYRNCMELADQQGISHIAFPAISTGIYGYPLKQAARVAALTIARYVHDHPDSGIIEIRIVAKDQATYTAFENALQLYCTYKDGAYKA